MGTRPKNKKNTQQPEMQSNDADQLSERPLANVSKQASEVMLTPVSQEETANLDMILRELRSFRRDNREQLEDIKGEIVKTNTRLDEAEERIVNAEVRIQNTEDILAEMLKLQARLEAKITDQESRSRRENIRIYGLPEGAENESPSMSAFVEQLFRENLAIPDETSLQIERAHRSPGPLPPEETQPRSVLVRFLSYKMKETILRLAWQKKGFTWHGKRINLDNDYAPRILQKRREYGEVRRVLKDRQIPFQTLYPARLRVKFDDKTQVYDTVEEATQDLSNRGFTVDIIKPPETMMEQLRRLTWERSSRRTGGRARHATREANFKEKLQAYRRAASPKT